MVSYVAFFEFVLFDLFFSAFSISSKISKQSVSPTVRSSGSKK